MASSGLSTSGDISGLTLKEFCLSLEDVPCQRPWSPCALREISRDGLQGVPRSSAHNLASLLVKAIYDPMDSPR
jgi:hypothetical protein